MKVSIIGSGVYAKAIAKVLLSNGTEVTMWTELSNFKEVLAPEGTILTNSFEDVAKSKIIFVLTSSNYVLNILNELKDYITDDTLIVLGSKGVLKDGTTMMQLVKDVLPKNRYAVISGPTFAVDIAALEPVGFTVGALCKEDFDLIKKCMGNTFLEYTEDILAVELAGSLKNAYAIGSGILTGFDYGLSTQCLFMTRAMDEMANIFDKFGSDSRSIMTLAGFGDLVLTCSSPNSRNYTFGSILSLGNEEQKREYLASHTVEGYENLKAFISLFKIKNVDVPILKCIYSIVQENCDPYTLIETILNK